MPAMPCARLSLLALLVAVLAFQPAAAGTFSVTPVRIYMAPKDRAVAVTITNEGDSPVVLQADLNLWSQKADGTDELSPTDELILSPPILKLGPKARQVVRLARLKPADASRQLTYRMILREIPEAAGPKGDIQVALALALSMPVFITPPTAKREITCTARRAGDGVEAGCANSGSAYAQVREVLVKLDGQTLGRFEGGAYILPGARKNLPLKLERAMPSPALAHSPGAALQVAVTFDDGQVQTFDMPVDVR